MNEKQQQPQPQPVGQAIPAQPVAPSPQAVQNWDNAQYQQPQQVQYVVMQQSLQGVGGWLLFFLICMGLGAMTNIISFFTSIDLLSAGLGGAVPIVNIIFGIPLVALYIATIVFIALQKKLGKTLAIVSYAAAALASLVGNIISLNTMSSVGLGGSAIGFILAQLIGSGLIILYFVASKRVKATLVK